MSKKHRHRFKKTNGRKWEDGKTYYWGECGCGHNKYVLMKRSLARQKRAKRGKK